MSDSGHSYSNSDEVLRQEFIRPDRRSLHMSSTALNLWFWMPLKRPGLWKLIPPVRNCLNYLQRRKTQV